MRSHWIWNGGVPPGEAVKVTLPPSLTVAEAGAVATVGAAAAPATVVETLRSSIQWLDHAPPVRAPKANWPGP